METAINAITKSPRVEVIGNATLYLGDCREILPSLTGIDAVVTDPPYGTGGWRRDESGQGRNPSGKLIREDWDDGAVDWLSLIDCPVLTFWPPAKTWHLLQAANDTQRPKHRALYMHKLDPKPQPAGRIMWSVEPIWCVSHSGFQLYGGTDWMSASTPRKGRDYGATGHPYEKPIECLIWLVQKLSADVILDPFMGSGTTGVACVRLGRNFVGVEADPAYFDMACQRIAETQRQGDLLNSLPPAEDPQDARMADLFAPSEQGEYP